MKQPTEQDIIKAYNIARELGADSTCKVLEALYPDVDFTPKDNRPVEERIKTFDDALEELGAEHPLVKNYLQWSDYIEDNDPNLRAFLQLRIITAALNDGWEPQFDGDELRWYLWFALYSADELAVRSDEWKAARIIVPLDNYRVFGWSNYGVHAYGGCVFAVANFASSYSGAYNGTRLTFKTEALAKYAARQFADLWADFHLVRR